MCSTSIGFSRDFLVMKEVTTEKMNQIRGNLYHWFLKHSPTGITHIPKYILFINNQDIGIYIYMLRIAGQMAGLKFFVDAQGWPGGVMGFKKLKFV